MSKWTTNGISNKESTQEPAANPLTNGFVVLLLYGKNSFGDKIFSFVKINLPNLPKLKSAILAGKGFTPSDFGEVVAAGKGDPSPELRAEVAAQYPVMDGQKAVTPPPAAIIPTEKKAWDEY